MDIPALPQHFDPNGGNVTYGDDSKLFVQFYTRAVKDEIASREQGRPIHASVTFVKIQQPGERDCLDRPAHQGDAVRFNRHFAAYQAGKEEQADGTLLAILFPNNPEFVENYRYAKITTVEQLAQLSDTQIQNLGMGALEHVRKAKALLATASRSAEFHELEKKLKDEEMKRQELTAKVEALTAALALQSDDQPKRGPGRPRKEFSDAD